MTVNEIENRIGDALRFGCDDIPNGIYSVIIDKKGKGCKVSVLTLKT